MQRAHPRKRAQSGAAAPPLLSSAAHVPAPLPPHQDEPTNHLDIESKETLEQALQGYGGTLITVSHDRYFVSQVATVILSIDAGEVSLHEGDYRAYMEQDERLRALVEGRYVEGERTIRSAPKVELADEDTLKKAKKKGNFGGKGVTSGRKDKGVKNAKRMAE